MDKKTIIAIIAVIIIIAAASYNIFYDKSSENNSINNEMPVPGTNTPEMIVEGTFPVGETPDNLTDEELASS